MLKELEKVKYELETLLLEILEKAPLKEEIKNQILSRSFGSLNYQIYLKKTGRGNHRYEYHHLSGNIKTENGRWKTISLKSVRSNGEILKKLAVVYNSLKRSEEIIKDLKSIGVD